jgi:hypothetical protein
MNTDNTLLDKSLAALVEAAYIYGYPMVDMYSILYKYVVDTTSPEYKAPLNTIYNTKSLATPEDTAIVAPNSDTPYSYVWLDLRAEPIVLTVPSFDAGRYVSVQLNDLYTYIFGYITPRTNGNGGGDFLIAGPGWEGDAPAGITQVLRSSTELALALYRTQLFGPDDLHAVWAIQDKFQVTPLSIYTGMAPPPAARAIDWISPLDVRKEPASLRFFAVLNWMLQYAPALAEEHDLRQELAGLGVGAGPQFGPPPAVAAETFVAGMQEGLQAMQAHLHTVRSSGELFGSRAFLKKDYMSRAVGAMVGILGNAKEEYLGIGYQGDAEGKPLRGSNCYEIHFGPGQLPPVMAFWSITCYTQAMLLYANPLKRYLINSPMVKSLTKDADGGFTLYVQHQSPGREKESNWLPTPAEGFNLTFRCYQPEAAILDFTYRAPPVVKAGTMTQQEER